MLAHKTDLFVQTLAQISIENYLNIPNKLIWKYLAHLLN